MVNANIINEIGVNGLRYYISIEMIFISLYLFAMMVLIIRIQKGIKQKKMIKIQDKIINEQSKLIELLK